MNSSVKIQDILNASTARPVETNTESVSSFDLQRQKASGTNTSTNSSVKIDKGTLVILNGATSQHSDIEIYQEISELERNKAVVQGKDCSYCLLPFDARDHVVKSCV